jgi:hypothetical protein
MPVYPEVGDIMRLTLVGRYDDDQDTNNVFYVEVTDTSVSSEPPPSVANYCWGLWVPIRDELVTTFTAGAMKYSRIKGEILDGDTNEFVFAEDYIIPTLEGTGGQSGDALPSSDAFQLRLQRPNANFRHGYKRFAGVSEEDNVAGVLSNDAFLGLTALAVALSLPRPAYHSVFTEETPYASAAFELRVGQFIHNGDPLDVPVFAAPSAIVANPRVVTQNTRKHGTGS